MEQPRVNNENHSLIIDIPDGGNASTSGSSSENDLTQHGNAAVQNDQPSSGVQSSSSSSNRSNSRPGPSFYKVLVSVKLTFKMSLILSSMITLIMSRHEKPRNPLFAWIVGYTVGCAVSIPIIFRHYFISRPSLCRLVDRFRWLLEFFSALWFVLGNYWIFGEKSYSNAHIMYRFGVVLLVFDYIKYIGPTILCAIVLCCYRGLLQKNEAAPTESINALPTYKFKLQGDGDDNGGGESAEKRQEGGIVAAGTEKERALSSEDAVCCICLADYTDNDVLKELPCTHLFHATCVDSWLKIKAFCPLCKCMIEKSAGSGEPQAATDTNQQE